ncbi:hypothetical protein M0813_08828 [Anaeramoeba flamelloides]|uniref:Uncharacterized protein n=1 Tax=Anaeramoeba flamelloides TaxID=1746091 RepID=A0ABQ8X711_9EUKA|nr:hypothetical protein M0813_08828 [Anaeramoeba flamelloides]
MSYYDDNDYDYDNQRRGISDGTKQFLIIFFSIFGACHVIALFRRIINYGTFCSGRSPLAMNRRTRKAPKTINEPLLEDNYLIEPQYDQDILDLANEITDELDKVQFNQGPLNTDMNNNMNMNMNTNMNNNNNLTFNYERTPLYEENSNNLGGEMFVGQNNNFVGQNNNFSMNTNMNTNMNMDITNQTNNSQSEEMNKIIDKLEINITNLGQNQQTSELMNLVENIRLNENMTKEDVRNLATEVRSLARTSNNNQRNEKIILRTTNQNTATQETDIEPFDPASFFLQSIFTFLPLFIIRMALMAHFSLFFAGCVITWVFSVIEILFDTLLRIAFYLCTPAQVRHKTTQIIEEKITFCILNLITIIQLALILYFPVFPWFWVRKPRKNDSKVIIAGALPVTPRNRIAEREWTYKPLLGRASTTLSFLLALFLTYGFGVF